MRDECIGSYRFLSKTPIKISYQNQYSASQMFLQISELFLFPYASPLNIAQVRKINSRHFLQLIVTEIAALSI